MKSQTNKYTFDPIKHEYRLNGDIVPHITRLLPFQYNGVPKHVLEKARNDGLENHAMIKLYFDTKDTFGDPMLEALHKWLKQNKIMLGPLLQHEQWLFSEKYKFAGTPDAIFANAIPDFKRTFINSKYHALQIAAQHILAVENGIIKKTKMWLIPYYDGREFQAKNVYNDRAEAVFIGLVRKYWIDVSTENYFKEAA